MALSQEHDGLYRELGDKDVTDYTEILQDCGTFDGAMALQKETEPLCHELGNPAGLAISLANQALLLSSTARSRNSASQLAHEALAIAIRHGYQRLVPQFQRSRDLMPVGEE